MSRFKRRVLISISIVVVWSASVVIYSLFHRPMFHNAFRWGHGLVPYWVLESPCGADRTLTFCDTRLDIVVVVARNAGLHGSGDLGWGMRVDETVFDFPQEHERLTVLSRERGVLYVFIAGRPPLRQGIARAAVAVIEQTCQTQANLTDCGVADVLPGGAVKDALHDYLNCKNP